MNMEAAGAEQISAALEDAGTAMTEKAEEIDSLAALFGDAADRYESLGMSPSTLEFLRDAADAVSTASGLLTTAAEYLSGALADFLAKDATVAEAAQDAGNLASEELLLG